MSDEERRPFVRTGGVVPGIVRRRADRRSSLPFWPRGYHPILLLFLLLAGAYQGQINMPPDRDEPPR